MRAMGSPSDHHSEVEERLTRLELTLLEVLTALGMLTGELALRKDLALSKPEVVERALEQGWETLFGAAIEREARDLQTLFEIPALAAESAHLREQAPAALARTMADTGAAVGALYGVDRAGDEISLLASEGYPTEVMAAFLSFGLDADLPA